MLWLFLGALLLLAVLAILLPAVFNWLGLSDRAQALALPEGSVRAVIALVLIVLFAAAPIYLFNNVSGSERIVPGLEADSKTKFETDNKALHPVFVEVKGDKGPTYTAYYREASDPTGVDFAKQMLVLLGTLATAVTSFYFGAKTATSASAQGAAQASVAAPATPVVRVLTTEPAPLPARAPDGSITFKLHLTGSGLNNVKTVKLASSKDQFSFSSKSNDVEAICDVTCTPTSSDVTDWDVSVIDGVGTVSDSLRGFLKF